MSTAMRNDQNKCRTGRRKGTNKRTGEEGKKFKVRMIEKGVKEIDWGVTEESVETGV